MPDVSVVVATHNRAPRLRQLLAALDAQTLDPARFEIIVVDDGSSDETPQILARTDGITVLTNRPGKGPGTARNAGWRKARAPLVAFTDDDCVPHPAWLERGLQAASSNPGAVVQGHIAPNPDELHLLGPFARTLSVTSDVATYATANMFYPRAILEQVGGFDEDAYGRTPGGEDTDLAWRAITAGASRAFAADATVYHAVVPLGPVGKLKIAARWTATMRTFRDYPDLRREQLTYNLFWKGSHYLLVRALVAMLLPRRLRLIRQWLAMPYLLHLLDRGRVEGGGPALAPYYLVHDLVELYAVVRGAVRYRTPVL